MVTIIILVGRLMIPGETLVDSIESQKSRGRRKQHQTGTAQRGHESTYPTRFKTSFIKLIITQEE